jgi:hypothetical protein
MFVFGTKLDAEGFAYVGTGDDDDPFLLGVTTVALLESCVRFASNTKFSMFHADATIKLSDLGYPVITCEFTDEARSYKVAALFVVSQRTTSDYAKCFQALARVTQEVAGKVLHGDAAMGDAGDAHLFGSL